MESNNRVLVIFGYGRFDSVIESVSFILAKELAKRGNMVYYVDYPFTTKDILKSGRTQEYHIRKRSFRGENQGVIGTELPNLKLIILPPLWSIHFLPEGQLYRRLLAINERRIGRRISAALNAEGVRNFVFINSWVFHYPNLAKFINPALRVYQCIDPVIMDYDKKHGVVSEAQLIANSDMVVCTSKQLYDEKSQSHANTHFIPNAADVAHSALASDPGLPLHKSVASLRHPIIGFFGRIEKRIDYPLILEVIRKNPQKTFVFAGPVDRQWVPEELFSLGNVVFTGSIKHDEMPNVVKAFDVAIIPFRTYQHSATVFPMKLFEYLGAGKPVVVTDFNPNLKEFTGDLVHYCADAQEFSSAIETALQEDSAHLQRKRFELAGEHTWSSRAQAIEDLIAGQEKPLTVA